MKNRENREAHHCAGGSTFEAGISKLEKLLPAAVAILEEIASRLQKLNFHKVKMVQSADCELNVTTHSH